MRQILFGRIRQNTSPTTTEYQGVELNFAGNSTENRRWHVCPASGTINNLKVRVDPAPDTGKSYKFTLMVDSVASALTVTISDLETSAEDTANSISVSAGETLSIQIVPTGTPDVVTPDWIMDFTADEDKASILLSTMADNLNPSATEYANISGGNGLGPNATELSMQQLCAGAGTIKSLYVKLSQDPGVDPDGYRFTVRLNGSSTSLTVTIIADDTAGDDTSNSFTVAAGDLLDIMIEPLNTPIAVPSVTFGVVFVSDIDGEWPIFGGCEDILSINAAEVNQLRPVPIGELWAAGGTASSKRMRVGTCILRKMYVHLTDSPGSGGDSYTFTAETEAGGGGNLSVAITNAETDGNDTVNSESLVDGDWWTIRCTPANTPTNTPQAKWGWVMFLDPNEKGGQGSGMPQLVAAGYI